MARSHEALTRLGRALAAAQDTVVVRTDAAHEAGAARFLDDAAATAGRRRRGAWGVAAAFTAAAAAAALLFVVRGHPEPPLGFVVAEGAAVSAGTQGAWIEASSTLLVRFSEGTEFELVPGARARVSAVDGAGARVDLERGELRAAVVPRAGARWSVGAGPFEVAVRGTAFDVAWTPAAGAFGLSLREGTVFARGPLLGEGRIVVAGEVVHVSVPDRHLEITAGDPARLGRNAARAMPVPAIAERTAPTPAAPPAGVGGTTAAGPRAPDSSATPPTPARPRFAASAGWRALHDAGAFAEAVAAAEAEGFTALCSRLEPDELFHLGDAARLAGNAARAHEAFGALRRRFPVHPRAASAAFMLGRVAMDLEGATAAAVPWFRTYVTEVPGGPFAREAAGRLLEALDSSGDRAGAAAAARAYLESYPAGPHAALAEGILSR